MKHALSLLVCAGCVVSMASGQDDPWAPPAGYYSGATGTGSVLKGQLTGAMSAGHILRTYGDFRYMSSIIDADPDLAGRILLVYNRASVSGNWDSGRTWNREHVWPQSLQPGSANNSTTGNLGDPHALRPANPSINSSRGNKPFGGADLTGGFRSIGAFYFPGDADKGDIARALFYSDTRYSGTGISLVYGSPGTNQMGDLGALLAWHYLDIPDDFERRRNHTVYSQAANPQYFTRNRNAYIDHPEFVWSVYVDQMNDTTLYLGDLEPADGESTIDVDLGNLLVGTAIDPIDFVLNKSGMDGTYYTVSASDGLSTSLDGPYHAFAMGSADSETMTVSFDPDLTATAGLVFGSVTIDNLDVTTQGGPGKGANDGDDMVLISAGVFNPGNGSFAPDADQGTLLIDLGTITQGSGDATEVFTLFNIAQGGSFAAPIDVELISGVGDTTPLSTDFSAVTDLSSTGQAPFTATLDDASSGSYNASYTFRVYQSRGMFPGNIVVEDLTLDLTGVVESRCGIADLAPPFGVLNFFDVSAFLTGFGGMDPVADLNGDGAFNFFDVSAFLTAYGAGCP